MTSNPKAPLDLDPAETADWLNSLEAVLEHSGEERAAFLIQRLFEEAQRQGICPELPVTTDYVNTIPVAEEPAYPGDRALDAQEERALARAVCARLVWKTSVRLSTAPVRHGAASGASWPSSGPPARS